jgi:sugar phosphate isomerase/epimerase
MKNFRNWLVFSALLISAMVLYGCERSEESADVDNRATNPESVGSPFRKDNLVAWCIVPFDAKKRGPDERAQMLEDLGISRLAYDWRDEHIVEFDDEIDALNRHGIRLEAFWIHCNAVNPLDTPHQKTILELLERRKIKTQLWVYFMMGGIENRPQQEKVALAADAIGQLADAAQKIGCRVGLYNHGGWFGEVENQVAIIEHLDRPENDVGIVYNFHHGHGDMDRFAEVMDLIKPYLMALNINGMQAGGPKVMQLGTGTMELGMLKIVRESGFDGPIGILGHHANQDVAITLTENLDGLQKLLVQLGDTEAIKTY